MKAIAKTTFNFLFIALIVIAAWVLLYRPDWLVIPPFEKVSALSSDKYDGDCQPTDTVGRCADKCPAATSEGVYYLQGYDKDTGAAVCGFSYYHECPYASAVSADSPECAKIEAEQQATIDDNNQMAQQEQADPSAFVGK